MKAFNFLSIALVSGTVIFASCLKDDNNDNSGILPLIQHSWAVDSITLHNHTSAIDTTAVYYGQAADYFNFGTDGNLYTQLSGTKDTSSYFFLNTNTIVLIHGDGARDTGIISTLTNNRLIGTSKKITNSTDYTETTSYLKR